MTPLSAAIKILVFRLENRFWQSFMK